MRAAEVDEKKRKKSTHALQLAEARHRVEVRRGAQHSGGDAYRDVLRSHLGVRNGELAKEADQLGEEASVAARQRRHRAAATARTLPPELRSDARSAAAPARNERLQRDER